MPDKDASTPRTFLLRHGPTTWSQSGRYTGVTDIPLVPEGESLIRSTASHIFGAGKLIDPDRLERVYVSPRSRAGRTLDLLFESQDQDGQGRDGINEIVTEDVAEWGYGEYEGLLTNEIRSLRKEKGMDGDQQWDIWRDGCTGSGGETPSDVQTRVDKVISEIVQIQGNYLKDLKEGTLEEGRRRDVLIVAHGHILRAFVKRWLNMELGVGVEMMLEPGGVCGLSYAHGRVEERAVLVGMAFPSPGSSGDGQAG